MFAAKLSRRSALVAAAGAAAIPYAKTTPAAAVPAPGGAAERIARYQADAATLVVGHDGGPSDIDPHSQYDHRSATVVNSVYEGLLALKGESAEEVEPVLAESWEANEDQSVWTFRIRPDVTFHNGDPCDANAIKASFERLLAMKRGAYGVVARFVTDPEMMSAPDPLTLVFDLGQPQPLFPAALASAYGTQVVNVNVAMANEEDGDFGNFWLQTNSEGAGTGPWIVTEFDPATGVIMERNPDYWGGWEGEHLERVVLRAVEEPQTMRQLVESGDVDIMELQSLVFEDIEKMKADPDLVVDVRDSTAVEYLTMTVAGPLATPEARQAMCYAFPYQAVIDGVYLGMSSRVPTVVASTVRGYAADVPVVTTDLEKARELLAEAGVAEGTELTLMMGPGGASAVAELFQASLAEIGITLNIDLVDLTTFTATFYGDAPAEERPHFMRWIWSPDYNDAWNVLDPTTACHSWGSAGSNGGLYCNEEFDERLEQAKNAATPDVHETALAEAQQIIGVEDPSVVAITQLMKVTVYNRRVQGLAFSPINLSIYNFYRVSKAA